MWCFLLKSLILSNFITWKCWKHVLLGKQALSNAPRRLRKNPLGRKQSCGRPWPSLAVFVLLKVCTVCSIGSVLIVCWDFSHLHPLLQRLNSQNPSPDSHWSTWWRLRSAVCFRVLVVFGLIFYFHVPFWLWPPSRHWSECKIIVPVFFSRQRRPWRGTLRPAAFRSTI